MADPLSMIVMQSSMPAVLRTVCKCGCLLVALVVLWVFIQ